MDEQPQCPFCQAPFETVEALTLHLIFDSCSLKSAETGTVAPARPQPDRLPVTPELVLGS